MRLVRPRSVQATSGQLAAGVRAGPGLVGYLGADAALTAYTSAGAAPPGCSWRTGPPAYMTVDTANTTLDHCKISGELLVQAANVTITNCKILTSTGSIYGIFGDTGSSGDLTIRDTTVQRLNAANGDVGGGFGTVGSTLKAYRCDLTGMADSVQPNLAAGMVLSQLCVHDLALVDPTAHLDPVQVFQPGSGTGNYGITMEHCWLNGIGSDDPTTMNARCATVAPNSAATFGQNTVNALPKYNPLIINNCRMAGGGYHLRLLENLGNVHVTNNSFGQTGVIGPNLNIFGTHVIQDATAIVEWAGNTDYLGNPLAQ